MKNMKKSNLIQMRNYHKKNGRNSSYNSLPIKKKLTFHNVIILIKSVVNKNKDIYYYNRFLEKGSYKYKSNKQYF